MELRQKQQLIEKLVIQKENILLDYLLFYKKHLVSEQEIFDVWRKGIRLYKDIPIKFYLHIPFCSKICTYCMYNTILIEKNVEVDMYIEDSISYMEKFVPLFQKTSFL